MMLFTLFALIMCSVTATGSGNDGLPGSPRPLKRQRSSGPPTLQRLSEEAKSPEPATAKAGLAKKSILNLNIFCATWNMGDKKCDESELNSWLNPKKLKEKEKEQVDVVAIGLQECGGWPKVLDGYLGKFNFKILKKENCLERKLCVYVREGLEGKFVNSRGTSKYTGQWVKNGKLKGTINKGAAIISTHYVCPDGSETSMCFASVHLTSGQPNMDRRNKEMVVITKEMRKLGTGNHDYEIVLGDFNYRIDYEDPENGLKRQLDNDDNGLDLDTPTNELKHTMIDLALAGSKGWAKLYAHDQLRNSMGTEAWQGFSEAPLRFAPTYKHELGSKYLDYGMFRPGHMVKCKSMECKFKEIHDKPGSVLSVLNTDEVLVRFQKSEHHYKAYKVFKRDLVHTISPNYGKSRSPAWCDRILHRVNPKLETSVCLLFAKSYASHPEVSTSDHKPVTQEILIVKKTNPPTVVS